MLPKYGLHRWQRHLWMGVAMRRAISATLLCLFLAAVGCVRAEYSRLSVLVISEANLEIHQGREGRISNHS